jgi:hypothetical protein
MHKESKKAKTRNQESTFAHGAHVRFNASCVQDGAGINANTVALIPKRKALKATVLGINASPT